MSSTLQPPSGPDYPAGWSEASAAAVARFDPTPTPFRKAMAVLVANSSRGLMRIGNRLAIHDAKRLDVARDHEGRGLLTFSNHVSLFDDPLLISNLGTTRYDEVRWIPADHRNFLMTHHRKLGRWLQLGGHVDGDDDSVLRDRSGREEHQHRRESCHGMSTDRSASGWSVNAATSTSRAASRPFCVFASNRTVRFGVVLLARTRNQPSSVRTRAPSTSHTS